MATKSGRSSGVMSSPHNVTGGAWPQGKRSVQAGTPWSESHPHETLVSEFQEGVKENAVKPPFQTVDPPALATGFQTVPAQVLP